MNRIMRRWVKAGALIFVATLVVAACEGPAGPTGTAGPDGTDGAARSYWPLPATKVPQETSSTDGYWPRTEQHGRQQPARYWSSRNRICRDGLRLPALLRSRRT